MALSADETTQKIDDILTRGVGEFIDPDDVFRKKLLAKARGEYKDASGKDKDIIVKFGVDPTRADIHLGHMVCFRKLRQLQDLGCKVIFLIGDFTAQIGDPTGKSKLRPEISFDVIRENMLSFLEPLERGKILNTDEALFDWISNTDWYMAAEDMVADKTKEVLLGSDASGMSNITVKENSFLGKAQLHWNSKKQRLISDGVVYNLSLRGLLTRLRKITLSQLKERDMFQRRIENDEPLFMHEMIYPVMQGMDSVMLASLYGSCDLEIGGTDQTFNMLMGRTLMQDEYQDAMLTGNESQAQKLLSSQSVLSFKLLEGLDGKEKMSKSLDNYIGITDEPNMMFGKVMSLPDTSIINYMELCTEMSMQDIAGVAEGMVSGMLNPRDAKIRLAKEIVTLYHDARQAQEAEQYFLNTFSKKEIPQDVVEIEVHIGEKYIDVLASFNLAESKSDARRKIEQGGVSLESEKLFTDAIVAQTDNGKVLKVGKKDFVRLYVTM